MSGRQTVHGPERPGEELHEQHAGEVADIAAHAGEGDADGPVRAEHLRGYGDIAAVEDVQKDHEGEPPQQGREAAADAGRQHLGAQVAPRAGAQDGGHGKTAVPVHRKGRRRGQRRHQRHGVRHQAHGAGKAPDEDGRILRLSQHIEYVVQVQQEVRGRGREHPWPEGMPPVVCEHKQPPQFRIFHSSDARAEREVHTKRAKTASKPR